LKALEETLLESVEYLEARKIKKNHEKARAVNKKH
jgi:hypothetical protein